MLVSAYTPPAIRRRARQYSCDEHYFETLTPEAAYWLGFIMADGNIYIRMRHGKPQFVFSADSNDREHLEWLRSCLGSDHPVFHTHARVHCLRILSYPLCLSLEKYGVVPCKSKILVLPDLAEDLQPYLWRGLVDGDGCFNEYHRPSRAVKCNGRGRPATSGQRVFRLCLVGSKDVCSAFKERFGGSVSRKANVYQATKTGHRAKDAVRWMYTDQSVPALDRKRRLAESLGILGD